MLDVRNAIANVLDRYTLADIVGITSRKLCHDRASFHLGDVLSSILPPADAEKPTLPRRTRRTARRTQPTNG